MGSFVSFWKHILIKTYCQATCFSPVCVVVFISICQSCFLCSPHCCWSKKEKSVSISARTHQLGWCTKQIYYMRGKREEEKYIHINKTMFTERKLARMPNGWNDWTTGLRIQNTHSKQSSDCAVVFFVYSPFYTHCSYTLTLTLTMTIEFGYKLQKIFFTVVELIQCVRTFLLLSTSNESAYLFNQRRIKNTDDDNPLMPPMIWSKKFWQPACNCYNFSDWNLRFEFIRQCHDRFISILFLFFSLFLFLNQRNVDTRHCAVQWTFASHKYTKYSVINLELFVWS